MTAGRIYIYCKSTNFNENLMLTNITNTKITWIKTIVNKRGLCMRKLYKPFLPREAAARCLLLEVSLCG